MRGGAVNAPLPLLDLLGARWNIDAPVVAACWDFTGGHVAFAVGDGRVIVVRGDWPGGPTVASDRNGRIAVTPLCAPPPAPRAVAVHDGACLSLAADPDGGFLSGGDDGMLWHIATDGATAPRAQQLSKWIDFIATTPNGSRAYASGRSVFWLESTKPLQFPSSVTALVYDRAGQRLAVAHQGAVTLVSNTAAVTALVAPGLPRTLAFAPDDHYLIAGLQENRLYGWRLSDFGTLEIGGYPGQPRSLSFLADGHLLATSGAARIICWPFAPPQAGDVPLECGAAGKAPVQHVACHPRLPLIAAGYHSGAALLCRPDHETPLLLKDAGGSPISALAWSPDGNHLAYASVAGEIGLVHLPPILFRPV
jgi:WD40 repeat protein